MQCKRFDNYSRVSKKILCTLYKSSAKNNIKKIRDYGRDVLLEKVGFDSIYTKCINNPPLKTPWTLVLHKVHKIW